MAPDFDLGKVVIYEDGNGGIGYGIARVTREDLLDTAAPCRYSPAKLHDRYAIEVPHGKAGPPGE